MKKSEIPSFSPLARLFAFGVQPEGDSLHLVGSDKSGFDFREGIPPAYMERSGRKVVRADFNGLGRLASQGGVFGALGGYYTFSKEVAEAIGGYPLGAILRWKDPETGFVRTVRSLKPDNFADFVEDPSLIGDGENWAFADLFLPSSFRPRIFPDFSAKETGTLSLGDIYTASRDCTFIVQGGVTEDESVAGGNSPVYVWATVRTAGQEKFCSAAMLAFIPPIAEAYAEYCHDVAYRDISFEKLANYTANYSASPAQLYLNPGDSVMITATSEISYSADYVSIPLTA